MTRLLPLIAYKVMTVMLSIMSALGMISTPSVETPISPVDPETVQLTFAAWGDPQVSNYLYEREANLVAACNDIKNSAVKLDALVIAGDIAENGLESEYRVVSEKLNELQDKVSNYIISYGNHDFRLKAYPLQSKRIANFHNGVSASKVSDHLYYSTEINGYKFIVMNNDKTMFEEGFYYDEQLAWLDSEIASTQDSGKPVFVVNHQPLKKTHGLPGTWGAPEFLDAGSIGKQSDTVKGIFEKYNNVIYITGHLHNGFSDYTYEDYGSFKSVNLPTVGCNNGDGYEEDGQGYVFEVYPDRIIGRARVFATGKYMPEYDFTIELN